MYLMRTGAATPNADFEPLGLKIAPMNGFGAVSLDAKTIGIAALGITGLGLALFFARKRSVTPNRRRKARKNARRSMPVIYKETIIEKSFPSGYYVARVDVPGGGERVMADTLKGIKQMIDARLKGKR